MRLFVGLEKKEEKKYFLGRQQATVESDDRAATLLLLTSYSMGLSVLASGYEVVPLLHIWLRNSNRARSYTSTARVCPRRG
jgi:hypothetical protein